MDGKSLVIGMVVGAGVLLAGMALGGATQGQPPAPVDATFKSVTASSLNIVNERGEVVASLGASNIGGELRVLNNSGQPVVTAGARGGGGELSVADRKGAQRIRLRDDGSVELLGEDRKVRLRMAGFKSDGNTRSDFSGQIVAFDRNENIVDKLPK